MLVFFFAFTDKLDSVFLICQGSLAEMIGKHFLQKITTLPKFFKKCIKLFQRVGLGMMVMEKCPKDVFFPNLRSEPNWNSLSLNW